MLINSIQACIKKAFTDYSDQEKGYPNCSTPWNEDILKLEEESAAYDGDYPPDELDDIQSYGDDNIYALLSLSDSKSLYNKSF